MCNGVTELKEKVENLKTATQLNQNEVIARKKLIDFHSFLTSALHSSYLASIELVGDSTIGEIASEVSEKLTQSLTLILDKARKSSRVIKFITGDLNKLGAEIKTAHEKARSFKAIVVDIVKREKHLNKDQEILHRFSLISSWILQMFQDLIVRIKPFTGKTNGENSIEELAIFFAEAIVKGAWQNGQFTIMQKGDMSVIDVINAVMQAAFNPKNLHEMDKIWSQKEKEIRLQPPENPNEKGKKGKGKKVDERPISIKLLMLHLPWLKEKDKQVYCASIAADKGQVQTTKEFNLLLEVMPPVCAIPGMDLTGYHPCGERAHKTPKLSNSLASHLSPISCTVTPPRNYKLVLDTINDASYVLRDRKPKIKVVRDEEDLRVAAANGLIDKVKLFVLRDSININGRGIRRSDAILIKQDRGECTVDMMDMTPLMLAAKYRRIGVVEFLVAQLRLICGTDKKKLSELLNVTTHRKETALDFASASLQDVINRVGKEGSKKGLLKSPCREALDIQMLVSGKEIVSHEAREKIKSLMEPHRSYTPGFNNQNQLGARVSASVSKTDSTDRKDVIKSTPTEKRA